MRFRVVLVPLLLLTGCDAAPRTSPAVARTPANWRPLDPPATEACALARDAYLGRGPYDARPSASAAPGGTASGDAVVAGIVAASRRSAIAGVRWQGELLDRGTGPGPAGGGGHTALRSGISTFYALCASGMWTAPTPGRPVTGGTPGR